jgi:allantoate deiminase
MDTASIPPSIAERAAIIMARCDELGAISEEPGRLTRRFATPALRRAMEVVGGWCREAGMEVSYDAVGNLRARYEGDGSDRRTLLLGSHLDSVRDAGRYDGPLGVLTALGVVEDLNARGERLPCAVDVLAFADEEGLRYQTSYLGSLAALGQAPPDWLDRPDEDGVTMRDAILAYGGDPGALAAGRASIPWGRDDLLGYCELHIEQGPVLEAADAPVGIVSAIQGGSRSQAAFTGVAGHAGTVPGHLRRDALCAAAEFVLAVEGAMRDTPGLVATVGRIVAEPGALNVIPGRAAASLDVRHPDDATRAAAAARLREQAAQIAATRGIDLDWSDHYEMPAVACSPRLIGHLEAAIAAHNLPALTLPSGAGHDPVALSRLTDVAMLFVRCKGGISHNPAESVTVEDVAVGLSVMCAFARRCAAAAVGRGA